MNFLLQAPAETTNYMLMGFAVIFGAMGIHLLSLRSRRKNLEQDLTLLEETEE